MTTAQIYAMRTKAYNQHTERFRRIIKSAFPDTGGSFLFAHNWYRCRRDNGPEQRAAEAILTGEQDAWHRIGARFDRWYAAAEHRHHSARGFAPTWCESCR